MVGADPMEDLVDPFKGFEFYAEGTRSCWGLGAVEGHAGLALAAGWRQTVGERQGTVRRSLK